VAEKIEDIAREIADEIREDDFGSIDELLRGIDGEPEPLRIKLPRDDDAE